MNDLPKQQYRMTRLTKQYLAILATAMTGGYVVTVHEAGAGVWAVAVQFEGQETQQIATSRGELKVWRNLIGAITFVQDNCAAASNVFIEVGGWRLCRLPVAELTGG
ncbi:hypothetical protein [Duganella rhizosphaerae]|uniref:hypothetical protein n=1 Tax=Duganella rhizosphaerae TaxID=2885763 RepID=UPI00403F8E3E